MAFGDFDNDGDIDILIMNVNEPPSLLRNDMSGDNHWLKVLLIGTDSNRSAIGAQVVAEYGERRQAQAVLGQSSYLSANDRRLHFGLGRTSANLEIRWPNGGRENVADVGADRLVVIREGQRGSADRSGSGSELTWRGDGCRQGSALCFLPQSQRRKDGDTEKTKTLRA